MLLSLLICKETTSYFLTSQWFILIIIIFFLTLTAYKNPADAKEMSLRLSTL